MMPVPISPRSGEIRVKLTGVRRPTPHLSALGLLAVSLAIIPGCRGDITEYRPEGYSTESHSNDAAPNYDFLFDTSTVRRIDVSIEPEVFEELRSDLNVAVYGETDTITREARISFDDRVWEHVGFRFKSLKGAEDAIEDGSEKFSFALTFDEYEAEYEDTQNQRFYGFKKLDFHAGHKDDSLLREVLTSEIFLDGGVPAARSAFVRVYVDSGEGPTYYGVYTLVEDVDDAAMLEAQFGSREGNLYEPEGEEADLSHFAEGSFVKKTNQEEADYSDVQALIAALNDTSVTGDAYRSALEATLDVDGFLRFLALNSALVDGDAYGCKAENYYLYGVPDAEGRLTFVPTDFNEALRGSVVSCGSTKTTAMADTPADLYFGFLGETMPLITRPLGDATYRERYRVLLGEALQGAFAVDAFAARARELHDLIAPYVVGDEGEQPGYTNIDSPEAFEQSVDQLVAHVTARHVVVAGAAEAQP